MKNIVNIFKEKYKILIPVMVCIVLLVTIFFLYKRYQYDNTKNKQEVEVFQCLGGLKTKYTAIVTTNLKDVIVDVVAKNKKNEGDPLPIYYSDMSKVVFPMEMNVVFPTKINGQYKLYKYGTYHYEEPLHYLKNNSDLGYYDSFFLFDGKGVYFFPEEVTLFLDGKEHIKLGPMSYVRLGGYNITYYDSTTDSGSVIEFTGQVITIMGDEIEININERYYKYFVHDILLMNPNNLEPLFKTIDK